MSIAALTQRLQGPVPPLAVPPVPPAKTPEGTENHLSNQGGSPGSPGSPEIHQEAREPRPVGIRYATPERLADDRRTCAQCRMLTPAGYCRAAARGELPHAARDLMPDPERLHRCQGYRPDPAEDADRRPGFERWPGLSRSLMREDAA